MKTNLLSIIAAGLLLAGCVSQPKHAALHARLHAIRLAHHGLNWDQWPAADQRQFNTLLQLEIAAK